jgi:ABC-type phosphate transport system substrate-binding protein
MEMLFARVVLVVGIIWPTAYGRAQEVVVNPSVSELTLSQGPLRAVFGMRQRSWPDGTPIRVFVLPDQHRVHVDFSKKVLEVFPHQLRSIWDRLVFSGTGQAPIQVGSEGEMRARVATTPGAIGYLSDEMIDDSVRVLQVN